MGSFVAPAAGCGHHSIEIPIVERLPVIDLKEMAVGHDFPGVVLVEHLLAEGDGEFLHVGHAALSFSFRRASSNSAIDASEPPVSEWSCFAFWRKAVSISSTSAPGFTPRISCGLFGAGRATKPVNA